MKTLKVIMNRRAARATTCDRIAGSARPALYWLAGACLALHGLTASARGGDIPPEILNYADFVFTGGQVLTADADRDFTVAEAVAVRGNRILAVGADEKILRLAGPDTRRVDLRGRTLTPGFIYNDGDNSVPAGDILKDSQWDGVVQPHLGGETLDQALATLSYIVDKKGKTNQALYFNLQDQWAATAGKTWDIHTLDEVAPETPVAIYLESSEVLANTAMIKLAVNKGFPPDHFHLERDQEGNYTGRGGAQFAGFIGREVRPWPDPKWFDDVAIPGAVKELAQYARHGVTVATGHMSAATMVVLNRLFHDGDGRKLAVRVYPGLDFLRQNPEGEKYLKRIGNLVDFSLVDERGPMVTIVGASVGPHSGTPDGAGSLLTIEPKSHVVENLGSGSNLYGNNRWTAQWITGLGQEDLTPAQQKQTDYYNVMLARKYGWNVTGIHNMGSEGIRLAMQNVLAAEHQGDLYVDRLWRPQGFDHNIDWVPEVYAYYRAHPELKNIIRFGISLRNVINQRDAKPVGIQKTVEAQYGMAGLERLAPLRSLVEHGIPFHIEGSEPKDKDAYPTWYIQKAVNRVDMYGRVIAADESIDRKTAFLALTRWAARFIGAEKDMGSIAPGKLADLVVLDGNLLDVSVDHIADLRPVMTLVGGEVAYEGPGL